MLHYMTSIHLMLLYCEFHWHKPGLIQPNMMNKGMMQKLKNTQYILLKYSHTLSCSQINKRIQGSFIHVWCVGLENHTLHIFIQHKNVLFYAQGNFYCNTSAGYFFSMLVYENQSHNQIMVRYKSQNQNVKIQRATQNCQIQVPSYDFMSHKHNMSLISVKHTKRLFIEVN